MNTNTVVTFPVAADLSSYKDVAVKLTSTGINLAGAADRAIGTLLLGNSLPANGQSAVGMGADVFLSAGNGLHDVVLGSAGAISLGDELEQWPSGRVGKVGGVITGTAEADDDLITITNHGFLAGQALVFTSLTGGAGLTAGITYYVISTGLTANAFSVATTAAGSAVNITTDYSALSVRPANIGQVVGLAAQSAPASSNGGVIRAIIFPNRLVGGIEVLTVARTLTAADSGKTFFLALAGGFTVTLPAVTADGFFCRFKALVAPTTSYVISGATADKIVGHALSSSGGAEDSETTAGADEANFVGGTSVIGDELTIDIAGGLYLASGKCAAAGGITFTN